MNIIAKYASLVKFSHTVFAMPFALMSYAAATMGADGGGAAGLRWTTLLMVLLCLVAARNAAMSFNRIADRDIDGRNPRTTQREIPSGQLSLRAARWFCMANSVIFVAAAALINPLAGWLSPVALALLLGYSYTKRFTWASHLALGLALAIAPVGAWIAVRGAFGLFPIVLAGVVLTWVGGFDIIYSLQDVDFDRREGLHSAPARFTVAGAIAISMALHVLSLAGVVVVGMLFFSGFVYWIGALLFASTLVAQHLIATPKRFARIGPTFTLVNGAASICYCLCAMVAMWI
ncbi:4-hydroxybenzoate octaprenyltransferase [Bacteroidia bacterium]|nr:4-hydroxybenzoate octaprenyltransferase [Bacteroidia bacterium]